MQSVRILIAEDDWIIAKEISLTLQDLGFEVIGTFDTGEELLQKLPTLKPDLILLDIDLAGTMTGIDIAEKLKPQGIPFIFLTAMADIQTIEKAKQTEPYAYLVKPVRAESLLSTIEISLYNFHRQKSNNQPVTVVSTSVFSIEDSIFVKAKKRLEKIKIADILWIEAEDIYAIIVTKTGKFILSQPLKNIEERLPAQYFMRVHRSFIVQLDKIQAIEENDLIIEGKHIAIGKTFKDKLMNRLAFL
jgi:DNA-binding LytR/AlgR family response regulator